MLNFVFICLYCRFRNYRRIIRNKFINITLQLSNFDPKFSIIFKKILNYLLLISVILFVFCNES